MENKNFSNNIETAKQLLKKILSEKLDVRIKNLELKCKQDLSILSSLQTTSNNLINNLIQFVDKKQNQEKKVIIPKLNFDKIYSDKNNNKKINGILKNSDYKNRRNREKPISNIFDCDTNKTMVSFWQKDLNETPDIRIKNKPFTNHKSNQKKEGKMNKTFFKAESGNEFNDKKKKKVKIKNMKCLTERSNKETIRTPLRLTLNKKIFKKDGNFNTNINNTISLNIPNSIKKENKSRKNANKTIINFREKKFMENDISPSSRNKKITKTPEKYKVQNEILKHERNLKSLCESMLIDVNKDELLVNEKIIPEFFIKTEVKKTKILLEENFKKCIPYFLQFLTFGELFQLIRTKKEILKFTINILINQIKKSMDSINTILRNNNNKAIVIQKKIKPFEFNQNALKAISLLNSISKINFVKSIKDCNNIKIIILIFDLYFISIGKKNILNNLNSDNNKKIDYICNYFKNNKSKLLGNIIENDLKSKKFDDLIINYLYEYSKEYIDIINPTYYKKINKDIAIFVFIIKNILDFIGISDINTKLYSKNNDIKIVSIHKARLNADNIFLDKLSQILNKFK